MKYNPKLCDTNLLPEHEQDDIPKPLQESVRIRRLTDRYAHDYRYVPNLGANELRAMYTAYTEEYEDGKDDIGVMQITTGEHIGAQVLLYVCVFIIGIAIGVWVG